MHTSLSRIFMRCNVPSENRRVPSDPKDFGLLHPGLRNPNVLTSSTKLPLLSTTFLRLFAGLTVSLSVPEQAFLSDFAHRIQ